MKCSVDGCDREVDSRGWCNTHYMRWYRHGDLIKRKPQGEVHAFINDVAMKYDGDECLVWPFFRSKDSGQGTVYMPDRTRYVSSRYICILAHGEPPTDEHEAAHSCGNGKGGCISKNHLRWATKLENEADKLIHGTRLMGEKHNMAKLTYGDVSEIRRLKGSMLQKDIGKLFGVGQQTVSLIHSGKRWKETE